MPPLCMLRRATLSDESDESDKSDKSDESDKSDKSDGALNSRHLPTRSVPPTDPAGDPGRGPFCLARVSRHEVPKTPGFLCPTFMTRPRQGVAPSGDHHYKRHPQG